MSDLENCFTNRGKDDAVMDEFKKLVALAWEEDSDVEDLDDLIVKCKEHNITALQFMESNPEDDEYFTNDSTNTERSLSMMESMADGRSNVPDGDLAFVSSHIAVNALEKICGSGENIFLTKEHRKWIKPYLEALKRLDLNGHVDCTALEENFFKIKKIPLELIWWLQSKGFVQLSNYVSSTMADILKTKKLNTDLWTLVVNCKDDVDDNDALSDDRITRKMTKDLLTDLILAVRHDNVAGSEACSVLLDSIVKELVKRVSVDQAPTADILRLLGEGSALTGDRRPTQLAAQALRRYLALTPYVPLPRALSSQADWVYAKNGKAVTAFIASALECLGVEESVKILQTVIREGEVNWRHLMVIVSTLVVSLPDAKKHLTDLLDSLVREALFDENRDLLTSAILLARQCCLEGAGFPPYDGWFGMTFGPSLTAAAFTFLTRFLSDLVPCEPVYCLQAHLKKFPLAPSGCERLAQDYAALARCRLADLKVDATRSLLGTESASADIALVHAHWLARGEILPGLLAASRLQRTHFEKEWLPLLLSSPHADVVEKLKSLGRIPNYVILKHAETTAAKAFQPESPLAKLERSLNRLQDALGVHLFVQDPVKAATSLVEKLTLSNLTERMPLANHEQMVEALSFSVDYLQVMSMRLDLPKPHSLPKLVRYLSERLSHCPRSHKHSLPDDSQLPGSDTMDLREFLAQESKITSEFLATPSAYLEQTVVWRHVPCAGVAKTATALLLAAFRPWAAPAGRKAALAALATVAQARTGDVGGAGAVPWMLKCWMQTVPAVCSHAEFFRVVTQLPRWLLLSDCRSTAPSAESVLRLAAYVNAELVVGLAEGSFLCSDFVWHLTVMMSQWSDAKLFNLLLNKCPAFHVGLLLYSWANLSHLSLAFPAESQLDMTAHPLVKLLQFHRHINQSQATVASCLNEASAWEVALVVFAATTRTERKAALTISQREINSSENLLPWLFYFHVLNLLDRIEQNEAMFMVKIDKVGFIYENILEPSPLQALNSILEANAKAVAVLVEDCTVIPLSGFSARTIKLASVTGLLYLLHRKFFEPSSHSVISEVLPKLKTILAQSHSLLPKFLGTDWKDVVANMNKLCGDVMDTVSHTVTGSQPDIYILDDDDDFVMPDDLP